MFWPKLVEICSVVLWFLSYNTYTIRKMNLSGRANRSLIVKNSGEFSHCYFAHNNKGNNEKKGQLMLEGGKFCN